MRRVVMVVSLVCMLVVLCDSVLAQDQRPQGNRMRTARDQMTPADPAARMAQVEKALGQLELKGEQKDKVDKLAKDYNEKVKAQQEKTKAQMEELQKDIQAAREAQDRQKMSELFRKRTEINAEGMKVVNEYVEAVKDVFGDATKGP